MTDERWLDDHGRARESHRHPLLVQSHGHEVLYHLHDSCQWTYKSLVMWSSSSSSTILRHIRMLCGWRLAIIAYSFVAVWFFHVCWLHKEWERNEWNNKGLGQRRFYVVWNNIRDTGYLHIYALNLLSLLLHRSTHTHHFQWVVKTRSALNPSTSYCEVASFTATLTMAYGSCSASLPLRCQSIPCLQWRSKNTFKGSYHADCCIPPSFKTFHWRVQVCSM